MNSVQTQTLSIKGDNDAVIYIDFCDGDLCASVVVEGKQADFHFEPTTLKMFAYAYKLHCEDMLNNSLKENNYGIYNNVLYTQKYTGTSERAERVRVFQQLSSMDK